MKIDEMFFLYGVLPLVAGLALGLALYSAFITRPCNCTVDWNGNQTSIEDAIHLSSEGLSVDQADEVQIMINNSLGR